MALATIVAPSLRAQGGQHPPSIAPDGVNAVEKFSEAERVDLLGAVPFYSIALYVSRSSAARELLASSDMPKALRIAVTYDRDLRRPETLDWRGELVPRLEPAAAISHLQRTFAALQHGDVVLIAYSPGKGTTVRVNRTVVADDAHHDLMLAFLDHWIGQRPVSEDLKEQLVGASW